VIALLAFVSRTDLSQGGDSMRAKKNGADGAKDTPTAPVSPGNEIPNGPVVRTTVVLPEYLYWTLTAWCARERLRKGDAMVELIKAGMAAKGLKPDRSPKSIKILY
jgi:hypothetical protein